MIKKYRIIIDVSNMEDEVKHDYQLIMNEQKREVRSLIMAGLQQIKEGKTKDFNEVCDRLERKYANKARHL